MLTSLLSPVFTQNKLKMSLNSTLPIEPYLIKPSDGWMIPSVAAVNTPCNSVPNPGMFYPTQMSRSKTDGDYEKPNITGTENDEQKQVLQVAQGPQQNENSEPGKGSVASTTAAEPLKPFSCEICRKCFAKASQYKQHKVTHSDYRPCPCTVEGCGKAFRRKSHLAEHMLIHSGIKV